MLRHAHQNKKQTPLFLGLCRVLRIQKKRKYKLPLLFVVAGVGFEPHDLQVMSLTSYRTAPSRDKMQSI